MQRAFAAVLHRWRGALCSGAERRVPALAASEGPSGRTSTPAHRSGGGGSRRVALLCGACGRVPSHCCIGGAEPCAAAQNAAFPP